MLLLLTLPVVDNSGDHFDFTINRVVDLTPLFDQPNDEYWDCLSAELRTLHRLGEDLLNSRPDCKLRSAPTLRIEEL